jgi:hypothetical protein
VVAFHSQGADALPQDPLQVGFDASSHVFVPKLTLIIVSPVVRAYLQQKSDAITAKFVHADISLQAVKEIAKWFKDICLKPEIRGLEMPGNVKDMLKLRLTAHTLGMVKYVEHFDYYYREDVEYRVPDVCEIAAVVDNTRKDNDPILVALANRFSYLVRYHKISIALENGIAQLLAEKKYALLLAAVDEDKVKAMAKAMAEEVVEDEEAEEIEEARAEMEIFPYR